MNTPLRKLLLPGLTAAGIALGAMAFQADTQKAEAAESFIFAHAMNVDHVFHAISERYMADLADQSGIEVEYHPGGDLGDWTSLFEQAMQGVVPMTLTWASSEFDSRLDLIYLGYIVSNWEDAEALYGPGAGMLGVYNDMLADLGLYALGIIPTDFGSVVIRKGVGELPMNFPDDPAGMKIRVPGLAIAVDRFNSFGFGGGAHSAFRGPHGPAARHRGCAVVLDRRRDLHAPRRARGQHPHQRLLRGRLLAREQGLVGRPFGRRSHRLAGRGRQHHRLVLDGGQEQERRVPAEGRAMPASTSSI